MGYETTKELFRKRDDLIKRLINCLGHFPLDKQYSIITSFLSIEELEKIVEFQEKH